MITIGAGFWFGTADISYKLSSLVIQPPAKIGKTSQYLSLLGGATAGSSIYAFRHIIQSSPSFAVPMAVDNSGSVMGNIRAFLSNFAASFKSLKNFPVRYYAITTVGSAMLAGVTTAILQRNLGASQPQPPVAKMVETTESSRE